MTKIQFKSLIKANPFLYFILLPLILLKKLILKWKDKKLDHFISSVFGIVETKSLVVRQSEFLGSFEIDCRSHILKRILKSKSYETELAVLAKKYIDPEKDAVDIGANIGLYTILFSKIINDNSKVLAVEPTPAALKYLNKNIQRNDCKNNVIVFEGIAASDQEKYMLNIIPGMEEYSSLGNMVHPTIKGHVYYKTEVKANTIDNLVTQLKLNPGFIKIDTEGSEFAVLSGALNTLRKAKPVVLSELSDTLLSSLGHSSEEIMGLLKKVGYDIFDAFSLRPITRRPLTEVILALPQR